MKRPSNVPCASWRVLLSVCAALAGAGACADDEQPLAQLEAGGGTESPDAAAATAPGAATDASVAAPPPPATAVQSTSDAGVSAGSASGCSAGDTRACLFDRLCSGVQTCGVDGTFGDCDCGAAALVGGGVVGARCESDADCAGGATCLRADGDLYLGAGGPAGGYCTFECVRAEDGSDDCAARDPQSFCAPLGPDESTYCIRTCLSLEPEPGEAKCLNRPDLVCVSVAADGFLPFNGQRQDGYCRPQCGSDSDCPAGRVCHAQAGICTDAQITGAPIGAACSLDSDCAGYACEDRNSENVGVCTATCVLGALSGCGSRRDDPARAAACFTPLIAAGRFAEGPGDVGLCRELCDAPADCERANEGWICSPLREEAAEFFGRSGACAPG